MVNRRLGSREKRMCWGGEEGSGTYDDKVHYIVIDLQLLEGSKQNPSRQAGGMSVN